MDHLSRQQSERSIIFYLILDDSGSSHSSPASLSQRPTPAAAAADLPKAESTVQKAPTPKEEPPVTRARRSRFESDATKSSAAAETSSAPPVVVRKCYGLASDNARRFVSRQIVRIAPERDHRRFQISRRNRQCREGSRPRSFTADLRHRLHHQ